MVVEEKPKESEPKVDYGLITRNYAVGYGSQWLATLILMIPVVIIWVIGYFAIVRTGLYFDMSMTMRQIVVPAIIFIPMIFAGVAHKPFREYMYNKWQKR